MKDHDIRTEPKYIVCFTQLLMLFKFCFFCCAPNPLVTTYEVGTMAKVSAICTNTKCNKEFIWKSQTSMPGTKIEGGNFLLSFATLAAGGSFSRVSRIFKLMGLRCFSLNTFFTHQRVSVDNQN